MSDSPDKNSKSLDEQLKEIQEQLAQPGAVLGRLGYYLHFLSPNNKGSNAEFTTRKGSTKVQKHHSITWVDIQNPTRREINKLTTEYPFHSLHLEDSLLAAPSPLLEKEKDYLFLLLQMPVQDATEGKIVASQVGIFLGKDYLITTHTDTVPELRQLFDECEANKEQRSAYFDKSSGYLLYSVLELLLRNVSDLVRSILEELDAIEDRVFDARTSDATHIGQLRQKIVRLRRTILPLKIIMADLPTDVSSFAHDSLTRYYRNIIRLVDRLAETADEAKETIEIYKDADFTASTAKTNEILAILTIIFTLAIPATIMGTFYGMNVPIPGGNEVGPWTFLGPYTTFILVLAVSVASAVYMFWYFKKQKWF